MTKKDYKVLAGVLANYAKSYPNAVKSIADSMAYEMKKANPRFDYVKWDAAIFGSDNKNRSK